MAIAGADFGATSLVFDAGQASTAPTGAYSIGLLIKNDGDNRALFGAWSSSPGSGGVMSLDVISSVLYGMADFSAGYNAQSYTDGTWRWIVLTKPAGAAHYRWHTCDLATLTWAHGEASGSGNHGDQAAAAHLTLGQSPIGYSLGYQSAHIAVAVVWASDLADAAVEAVFTQGAWTLAGASPDWGVLLRQADVAGGSIVDFTGGGGDEISRANIAATLDPALFDFSLEPPIAPPRLWFNAGAELVESSVSGIAHDATGQIVFGPGGPSADGTVVLTVQFDPGVDFEPILELAPGSACQIRWHDTRGRVLSTSATPSIPLEAGIHEIRLWVSEPDDVWTLNLGFHSGQDAPDHGGLSSSYNHGAQGVTGLANLQVLTGLKRLLCARTTGESSTAELYTGQRLQGALDVSGLENLEYVEVFAADITAVDVTGCTSLRRLCVEQCRLSAIDISPVRATIEDLRAAFQNGGAGLTITAGEDSYPALWHFCVRDQPITGMPSIAQFPVLEQWWVWNTGQTDSAVPISPDLWSLSAAGNAYTETAIDNLLVGCSTYSTKTGGTIDLQDGAYPSSTGLAAKAELEGRGWTVLISPAP